MFNATILQPRQKTKIAANSQGNTSTELSFHGSGNAYKVLPVGYTSIIHNLKKREIKTDTQVH